MGLFIDLVGQRFGRLLVLERRAGEGLVQWRCICDCGTETTASTKKLRNGRRVSCGCFRLESSIAARTRHGHAARGRITPELQTWMAMRSRCNNSRNPAYHHYGGRGIRVCDEWADFLRFLADMGPRPSSQHSIERIDNDGPYAPANCRWAVDTEQARNRRSTVLVTLDGEVMCAKDAAARVGLKHVTLLWRINHGWPADRLFVPTGT